MCANGEAYDAAMCAHLKDHSFGTVNGTLPTRSLGRGLLAHVA